MLERSRQIGLLSAYRCFWEFHGSPVDRCSRCLPLMRRSQSSTIKVKGEILSAFSLGYLFTQIPGGIAAAKYGSVPFAALALMVSGGAMVAMPWLSEYGSDALWWCQFIMGMAQGPSFPLNAVFIGQWVPKEERGWASSLGESGSVFGSLVAMGVSTWLGSIVGWQFTSQLIGVAVLAYLFAWTSLASSSPALSSSISPEEKNIS